GSRRPGWALRASAAGRGEECPSRGRLVGRVAVVIGNARHVAGALPDDGVGEGVVMRGVEGTLEVESGGASGALRASRTLETLQTLRTGEALCPGLARNPLRPLCAGGSRRADGAGGALGSGEALRTRWAGGASISLRSKLAP